jgi:hypothetical protein
MNRTFNAGTVIDCNVAEQFKYVDREDDLMSVKMGMYQTGGLGIAAFVSIWKLRLSCLPVSEFPSLSLWSVLRLSLA